MGGERELQAPLAREPKGCCLHARAHIGLAQLRLLKVKRKLGC